jgi:Ser-Thr-rich glycosyl-phosphatidyl-inositol-anchored membrane family protein
MKLLALFLAMMALAKADDAWQKPSPPTGSPDKIVKVNTGSAYSVPQGAGQPNPESPVDRRNPQVSLSSPTLEAGKQTTITWKNTGNYGQVNVDLVNNCGLMNQPLNIATVPANQNSYTWEVPKYLKDGECYSVRVWGCQQPRQGEAAGTSGNVRVHNNDPNANSRFIVNKVDKMEAGKPCKITWDYSPVSSYPDKVDVRVCTIDEKGEKSWKHLGTVPCSQKEFSWTPCEDDLKGSKHHFQVAGGPITEDCNFGANGETFIINPSGTPTTEIVQEEEVTETVVEEVTETVNEKNGAVVVKGVGMMVIAAIVVPLVMLL